MGSPAGQPSIGGAHGPRALGVVKRLERAEFDGIDLGRPPRGAWYRTADDGRIDVGARGPVWICLLVLLVAVVVTLLSGLFAGKVIAQWLDALGVRPLGSNRPPFNRPPTRGGYEWPLWLSTPFALLALVPVVLAWLGTIWSWFEPVHVVIRRDRLCVWNGYLPIRLRRCVDLTDVTDVGASVAHAPSNPHGFRVDQPTPEDRSPRWVVLHGRIERRGVCLIKFGGLLGKPRRLFVICAVKHAVAEAKRAERAGRSA